MAVNVVEILDQLNLLPGDGCLTRSIESEGFVSVIELRDAESLGAPGPATTRFLMALINPNLPPDWKGADRLELRDATLPDVVALAIADHNQLVAARGDWPVEALTFADDDTAYHNPFGDPQYGDWTGDLDRDQNVLVLRNPEGQYGDLYRTWRASMMTQAEAGTLRKLLAPEPESLRF
jgi:hypothetical protein